MLLGMEMQAPSAVKLGNSVTVAGPGAPLGALAGVKVLDLSRVLAGPWCTQTLADLGAEVIKIEAPQGDDTRSWGPPFLPGTGAADGLSAYFCCLNRNKQSVVVDLKNPDDLALIYRLAQWADVVVQNYRTGTDVALGVDYPTLAALNPRLIYCSISGYGRTGPYAAQAGYDFIIQAETGLMAITGPVAGGPCKVGIPIADILTGQNAVSAIVAALYWRQQSGQGQLLDLSLFDSQLAALVNVASAGLLTGAEPQRWGNAHPTIVPYQTFTGGDGVEFALAVGSQKLWQTFCAVVLGQPGLVDDPRFATNPDRVQHRAALVELLQTQFNTQPAAAWIAACDAAGIPAGPVNTVQQALAHPVTAARGLRVEVGGVPVVGSALQLGATPVTYRLPPPRLGADTAAVRARFGDAV